MSLAARLGHLGELLIALSGSPIPTHTFQTLADRAGTALPFDYLAICLMDPEGHGYAVHSLAATGTVEIPSRLFPADSGWPGRAMRAGRPVTIDDLAASSGGAADLEAALLSLGLRTALIAPVRRGFDSLGALFFARMKKPYTRDDVHVAALLASGVGAALETARASQALADERGTRAAVLGSTQDAVVVVNLEGIVLLTNPAVRPMLGLDPDAVTGRPLADVIDGALRALLEGPTPATADVALPDGRTAHASVVPVSTPFGEPVGSAAILRDITLMKTLEAMKNEFVNTVSHDLKNPILTITGTARLMLQTEQEDTRQRAWCQRILRTGEYMGSLVSDLLDLGRIESGLGGPGEEMDLISIVTDVLSETQAHAESKQIALSMELPEGATVVANAHRMKQALMNVVGNAVKYTPEGGRVGICVALSDAVLAGGARATAVVVRVTDTGIGIPAASLPYVFDKFYRVDDEAATGVKGTGLGLAIARSIVEAHGGRVFVESTEGVGSAFSIHLPAA
jgi:two-component system phosphate regulon sensor histidine kinase PhoR